ncbi:MAG TPA: paraquat-inducible protein A [Alphaproteobacteria bacterium]
MVPFALECPDCGLVSAVAEPPPGVNACCPRCGAVLWRGTRQPLPAALAWVVTGTLFYAAALSGPLLDVQVYGQMRQSSLFSGPQALIEEGWWPLAIVVAATTIAAPLAKLLALGAVLLGLKRPNPSHRLAAVFAAAERLGPWVMIDIYLLGLFVAYTRLTALALVHVEIAAVALIGLMVALTMADASLDAQSLRRQLERTGVVAPRRRAPPDRGSIGRASALLVGAAILYVPANIEPMMTVTTPEIATQLFGYAPSGPYTIMTGVRELIGLGMWPIALLVFCASILIPTLKLVGLAALLVLTQLGSPAWLVQRTRLYRVLETSGRWSMVDVFAVSLLVPLMQFGNLGRITCEIGTLCFAAVVVLTMLATAAFDPRLMWQAVPGERAVVPA